MRKIQWLACVGFLVAGMISQGFAAEDWKGAPDKAHFNLTVLQGYGVASSVGGYAIVGAASAKLMDRGFVPDLNNSLHAEIQVGPLFASGASGVLYSAHLRWDFAKDDKWTFYALGGLAGNALTINTITANQLYPRFGAGAIWAVHDFFSLRAEVSHELTALGLMFYL